jgi:hypothetical protein
MAKTMAARIAVNGLAATTATIDTDVSPMSVTSAKTTRTTLVLPETLDQNLELCAVKFGMPKGEIIKEALSNFLKEKGLQPDRRPKKVSIEY